MNTNIKIELTDEQRVHLQEQLTGCKRMISRNELTEFVRGALKGAMDAESLVHQRECFTPRDDLIELPSKWAALYDDKPAHWQQGWLRGWNMVGAVLEK